MNWIFLAVGMVLLFALSLVFGVKLDSEILAPLLGAISALVFICSIVAFCCGTLLVPREINAFCQQKAYLETHQASDPVEDAAISTKKVELNSWLYDAQYSKARWGGWSFYPDEIFDLEPIA